MDRPSRLSGACPSHPFAVCSTSNPPVNNADRTSRLALPFGVTRPRLGKNWYLNHLPNLAVACKSKNAKVGKNACSIHT